MGNTSNFKKKQRQTRKFKDLRVAILTQPLEINYGGLLQAYALSELLRSFGCDVTVVNRIRQSQPTFERKVKDAVKKYFLCKYINVLSPILFCKPDHNTRSRNTREFISNHIPNSRDIFSTKELKEFCNGNFDVYIVGSDQVWRPKFSPCISNYFLDFVQEHINVKKISYAASFGVNEWEYTEEQTLHCKELITKFDAVSVREDSAVDLCRKKFDVEAAQVLDPTLLLTKDDYLKFLGDKQTCNGGLFLYFFDQNEVKIKLADIVSKKLGLSPFSVQAESLVSKGRHNIKEYIVPPVEDWIRAFAEAEFVITDSFHGCAFSIIFQKPFLVIGNKKRGYTRFQSILSLLGLENRLIEKIDKFTDKIISEPVDWQKVYYIIAEEQDKSIEFLKKNLFQDHNYI